MKSLALEEALRVIVLVRRQDFTSKFSSFIWKSGDVEREAHQVVQTGERARQTVRDNTFNKSSDIQEREPVLLKLTNSNFCGIALRLMAAVVSSTEVSKIHKQNNLTQFPKTSQKWKEQAWSNNILCK